MVTGNVPGLEKVMLEGVFGHTVTDPLIDADGVGRTVTTVVEEALQPFTSVTVTLYVPEAEGSTVVMTGFCCVEVKPFGPVQK
jgi:hypothetical protein